jgi:hypothetical protein
MAERCHSSGDANFVIVPMDPALEGVAKRLIAHPEKSLSKSEAVGRKAELLEELREIGMEAQRCFPLKGRTKLLRAEAGLAYNPR